MTCKYLSATLAACALLVSAACGSKPASPNPAAPSVDLADISTDAAADGSTLKATAPTPTSPINSAKPAGAQLTLTATNAQLRFASGIPLSYRFEVQTTAGASVYSQGGVGAGGSSTSHTVSGVALTSDQTYRWRARAEYQGLVGPWSELASFVAPASEGYVVGNELYDPLVNGKTIGTVHGPVTFIPGVGIRLESQLSYVSYELPQTLTEGEFSILVTNLHENTEGGKTKMMAMSQGYHDLVVNDRRMTIEKRGDPPGVVAWRLITHGDQIDTEGAERQFVPFNPADTYLWEASWRSNFFNVLIRRGGANGPAIYSKGKHFHGRAYDPSPHVAYLGAPVGRSGVDGASVDGIIIRHVWISSRPRPDFAN